MWQVATQTMTETPNRHISVIEAACPNAAVRAGVEAAVLQYGISDLSLFVGDFSDSAELSPITYLDRVIPQLVSVGDYDTTVNPANTGDWVQRLIALGGRFDFVEPTNRAACPIGAVCGGPFTGLTRYWDLGGFGHGYQIFSPTPNKPNHLVLPTGYSCATVAFFRQAPQLVSAEMASSE